MGMKLTDANRSHFDQIDYIRAIASLGVALYHLGGKSVPFLRNTWTGVEMFFVLSGFIICWTLPHNYSFRQFFSFIGRRLLRIEPPYLISIGLILIGCAIFDVNFNPNWQNILGHIGYANNFTGREYLNPVYWTLGIEFQYYLFIGIFFPVVASKYGPWFLLCLSVIPLFIELPGTNLFDFFPAFAIGMLYYLYHRRSLKLLPAILFGLLILVCGTLQLGWLETIAITITLIFLISPLKSNRFVRFFSNISFSLYLTHDFIGSNLVVFLGQQLPKTLIGKGVAFLSGLMAAILFAYLFYLLVEKPALRFSKQILYKKQ